MIAAHGGVLINRLVGESEREERQQYAESLRRLPVDNWVLSDLDLIGCGAFSPLCGFMVEADYRSVVDTMRLADGTIWSIPITLAVDGEIADSLLTGEQIALVGQTDSLIYAVMDVDSIYRVNLKEEARKVFGTDSPEHPGVRKLLARPTYYIGGPVQVLRRYRTGRFDQHHFDPLQTREIFASKSWRTICGFQTRNPVHRAHEYIQKCALEMVDGLFLNPLVGETKADDIPAEVRVSSYLTLLDHYYPRDRVQFAVYPAAMRYAGPKEAVFHALVRKNYGCTHFIVGRDHAGVGNFYGTYDSQQIFKQFPEEQLGIALLFFEHSFFCRKCGGMGSTKTCPHDPAEHMHLSGTKVRSMLRNGERPPEQFTRPEVADVLIAGMASERIEV